MHGGASSQAILAKMLAMVIISIVSFLLNFFTTLNLAPADIQTVVVLHHVLAQK